MLKINGEWEGSEVYNNCITTRACSKETQNLISKAICEEFLEIINLVQMNICFTDSVILRNLFDFFSHITTIFNELTIIIELHKITQ